MNAVIRVLLTTVSLVLWAIPTARAATLLLEFDTRLSSADIRFPEAYSDLSAKFDENPTNGEFTVRLFLPDFERFASGTHEIPLNVGNALNWGPDRDRPPEVQTEGLALTLESRLLGPLEGIRSRVDGEDAEGKQVRAGVLLPDETQIADYGTLTVRDGQVVGFSYGWVKSDNPGIVSTNRFLVEKRGFPVAISALKIDVSVFGDPQEIGDLVLVKGVSPTVEVLMSPASE
ncbi:MAG: hypothetical protein AAGE01_25515 [Pseudomonadota bacterium]